MKKLIITMILLFSVPQIYAYEMTEQDKTASQNISQALEKYISKKGEKIRVKLIASLEKYSKANFSEDERKTEIIANVVSLLKSKIAEATTNSGSTAKKKNTNISTDPELTSLVKELNNIEDKEIKDGVRFDHAEAKGKTLSYVYIMTDKSKDDIDGDILKKVVEPALIQSVQKETKLKFLKDKGIIFKYIYKDKNGDLLLSITITPEQYNKAPVTTDLSSEESMIKTMIEEMNKSCPQKIDEDTQLDSVKYEGGVLTYSYTILSLSKSDISDIALFKKTVQESILKSIRGSDDTKFFKDKGTTIVFKYNDKDGVEITSISITPSMYR